MALGFVYFVFLPSIGTTLAAGRAVARLGTRPALWAGLGTAAAGLPLLVLPSLPAVLAGLALVGIGTFFAQATATGFVSRTAAADRASASGLYLASYFLGGLVGSAVLGQIFDRFGWAACVAGIGLSLAGGGASRDAGPDRSRRLRNGATLIEARTMKAAAHKTIDIDGVRIFYREAGCTDAPVVLLLHGFPSSSHTSGSSFRRSPIVTGVIAPDYPGFGYSAFPERSAFDYSFAGLADVVDRFSQALGLPEYALYIQDYGAPVGLRLAIAHPERVTALIVQNGNAYAEGLSGEWEPLKAYWRDPTPTNREMLRDWLNPEGIRLPVRCRASP